MNLLIKIICKDKSEFIFKYENGTIDGSFLRISEQRFTRIRYNYYINQNYSIEYKKRNLLSAKYRFIFSNGYKLNFATYEHNSGMLVFDETFKQSQSTVSLNEIVLNNIGEEYHRARIEIDVVYEIQIYGSNETNIYNETKDTAIFFLIS